MKVTDIENHVDNLKNQALAALGVDEATQALITLATAPNPEMGDLGFPCFVLAKALRKAPPAIAAEVAGAMQPLLAENDVIAEILAVGPYVNVRFNRKRYAEIALTQVLAEQEQYGRDSIGNPSKWMIEYSAPNTNKPQHLGHVRNNLLGSAVASVLDFAGHDVTRVNLINDRGIHICKSMLAYKLFGEGETPESSGIKGDHLVGRYYVRFEKEFQVEYSIWLESDEAKKAFAVWKAAQTTEALAGKNDEALAAEFRKAHKDTYFNADSTLGQAARTMLLDWEAGDEATVSLWKTMNSWVFAGFDETYARLGVAFDHVYYESNTYLLGKDVVVKGLEEGKFRRLDDGAIVCDMEPLGLSGQKVLMRRDGTSVYMTQDLGTALSRFDEYHMDNMVYVVGDEQDYHFQVLFKVLEVLRPELAGHLQHLSYGMVLLPEGKMKSREGTVVDADDLMEGMCELAADAIRERYPDLTEEDLAIRANTIGMAALKYYILDYNPRTSIHFDPAKSIDFEGRTGPYALYSYARIQSIRRKVGWPELDEASQLKAIAALESDLEFAVLKELVDWPHMLEVSARLLDPSKVTEYVFRVAKAFSSLYTDRDHRIVDIEDEDHKNGLLLLAKAVGKSIRGALDILGIETVDEM